MNYQQILSRRLTAVKAKLTPIRPINISIGDGPTEDLKHYADGDLMLLDIGIRDAS
jgi:hypothetical protein